MKASGIKTLFLDIGGVLLTDGWNRQSRKAAIDKFELDEKEINDRHQLCFDTYELGKTTFDEYLDHVIFYEARSFTKKDFIEFMLSQSKALDGAIDYFIEVKKRHKLKVIALSNEARDLNDYRIKEFKLDTLFDAFISSCYVKLRKPDPEIYRMACDVSQALPDEALYIDDRLLYIEVAKSLGIPSLQNVSLEATKNYMDSIGLGLK
jgi:putative hydrolase of the HAD superfamily